MLKKPEKTKERKLKNQEKTNKAKNKRTIEHKNGKKQRTKNSIKIATKSKKIRKTKKCQT